MLLNILCFIHCFKFKLCVFWCHSKTTFLQNCRFWKRICDLSYSLYIIHSYIYIYIHIYIYIYIYNIFNFQLYMLFISFLSKIFSYLHLVYIYLHYVFMYERAYLAHMRSPYFIFIFKIKNSSIQVKRNKFKNMLRSFLSMVLKNVYSSAMYP